MTSSPDFLYSLHLAVVVLNGGAAILLGFMLWSASLTNHDPFTKVFLKMLAGASWGHALAIIGQMYRASSILAEDVPLSGSVAGVVGRIIELGAYCVPIWFMLRPATRKALNGASAHKAID